jgi:DNA polymerase-3 subunit epsilon/CBS domain-containing protein
MASRNAANHSLVIAVSALLASLGISGLSEEVDVPTFSHSAPLVAIDAVVLDTETTGLDARVARVLQIGALRLRGGHLISEERFETLVNPGQPIPPPAIGVHGISDAMVAGAPTFAVMAPAFEAFTARAIIIGYAIQYDLAVLQREYDLAELPAPSFRALDIRTLARLTAPTLADYGLERLCAWLGVKLEGRHTAIGDARAAADVFLALIPLLRAKGIRTLAEAEAASRALADREAIAGIGASMTFRPLGPEGSPAIAKVDSFPYRHRVRDVMSTPPVFAAPETSVREVLRQLVETKISSVFVRVAGDLGIATERDVLRLLDKAGEAGLAMPVGAIAKAPLQTVAEADFLYRAIGRLQRLGFRHLGVVDAKGEIVGALTSRNLLRHRLTTAMILGDEIDSAATAPALATAWARLPLLANHLMQEEVEPGTISAVVSAEICAMTRRAAELAQRRMLDRGMGLPPVAHAVIVLGSAGRGESQLAADQDNAIVYAEGAEGGAEDRYFEMLADAMNEILDAAGVPFCKGGVMAKRPEWRKNVADWRATIDAWVRRQRPEDLLNVDIFFDGVPVYGTAALGEAIWEHAYARGHAARDFQNLLSEAARRRASAFTLLGNVHTDEHGRIDLKRHGLMPIFTAARVLSIKHDVRARSTAERLRGVAAKGAVAAETVDGILAAQQTILAAVIAQQLLDTEAGVPLSPRVNLGRLDKAEHRRLKAALGAVDAAVELVAEGRI